MKIKIFLILISLILVVNSCYEDPMGVGIDDKIAPTVELMLPIDQSEFTDADSKVEFSVSAKDFWGIQSYYLSVNEQQVQDNAVIDGNGFSISLLKEGVNHVWATAIDNYGNVGRSDIVNIYYLKSITLINPITIIELLDTDSIYTLNLNAFFYDSFDNSSEFKFTRTIENRQGNYNVSLTDSMLTLHTYKYFTGSGKIVITASKNDGRSAQLEIPFKIDLAEQYIRLYIPDANFRGVLKQKYNLTTDGNYIVSDDILSIDSLDLTTHYDIEDFEGLQHFKNLTYLNISGNKIKNVDFTNLTKILKLDCYSCDFIEDLDLSPLVQLEELNAMHNFSYLNLDVSHNMNLKKFYLSSNMETIDLSNNTKLEFLYFEGMQRIDLSNNVALKKIGIFEGRIKQLNLDNNTELEELDFTRSSLSELDIRNNQKLVSIKLNDNFQLTKTIVWELPLPSYITIEKDDHNIFVLNP